MGALMAERRAADEAGRQESLFEALEPAPPRNPWAPPLEAPRPHDDPHEPEATDAAVAPAEAPQVDIAPRGVEASPPLAAAPDTHVDPHDADESSEPRAGTPVAAAAADQVQAPRRAGAALAGPTLDDVMSRVWEGLVIGLPAACPVCHGEVMPSLGGPLLGRCGSCGTAID